jgi:hypothetical protein
MAETWSVTPTEGAENLGGGKFKFTPPTSGSITYTIEYINGTQTATTDYVVSSTDCVVCDCTKLNLTDVTTTVSHTGTTANTKVATINLTGRCEDYSKISISGNVSNVFSLSNDKKSVLATIPSNTTTADKSYSYVLIYDSKRCDKTLTTITQGKMPCKCEDFTFTCTATGNSMYIGVKAQTVKVGTIVINSSCAVRAVGLTPGITMSISNGEVFANVEANTTRLSKKLMYGFEMEGVGRCGDDFTLIQNLARGTDNGSDMFGPDIPPFSHPVLLNGNANDNCDTIVSEGGAYLKGYWLIRNGEKSEYVDKGKVWFNNNFASFVIDGWLTIDADKNGSCHYCNVSGVRVLATANDTNEIRSAILLLGTDGDHVLTKTEGCAHDPGLAGQPVLAEWEFEIKQAPNGKKWCCPEEKCNDCHSYTRVPVDMNYNCPCNKDN